MSYERAMEIMESGKADSILFGDCVDKTKSYKCINDLELMLELLRRSGLLTRKLEYELPANWNKGNVYVNLMFEDGRLNEVEVL